MNKKIKNITRKSISVLLISILSGVSIFNMSALSNTLENPELSPVNFELFSDKFTVSGAANLVKALTDNNTAGIKVSKVKFISKNETVLPNLYPDEFVPKGSFINEGTAEILIQKIQVYHDNMIHTLNINQTVFITVENLSPAIGVLDYFYQISGKTTLTAMHNNDHDNLKPSGSTDRIYNDTGVIPAIWSNDFLYNASYANDKQRHKMIDEMIKQWNNGAIVQLLLHVAPPTVTPEDEKKGVPWNGAKNAVISDLTDKQWDDLLTEGGSLNTNWKRRLDVYAKYMQQLKDAGVVFLFRPFHEMNQHVFWWGGRPKVTRTGKILQNATADLYCMTREYLEKEKGLDNIIWVWNVQDLGASYGNNYQTPYSSTDWQQFNPSDDYWDIFTLDIYDNSNGTYTAEKYKQAKETANGKPFAIGECFKLPKQTGSRSLAEQPEWVFFMPWAGDTWEQNSLNIIRELYQSNLSIADTPRFKFAADLSDDDSILPSNDSDYEEVIQYPTEEPEVQKPDEDEKKIDLKKILLSGAAILFFALSSFVIFKRVLKN